MRKKAAWQRAAPGSFKAKGRMNEPNTHPNERDPEAVQVWDCTVEGRLKRIDLHYLYQQGASSFQEPFP